MKIQDSKKKSTVYEFQYYLKLKSISDVNLIVIFHQNNSLT